MPTKIGQYDVSYVEKPAHPGYYIATSRETDFREIVEDAFNKQWNPLDYQKMYDPRQVLWARLDSLPEEEAIQIANAALPGANTEQMTTLLKEALIEKWIWALKAITNQAASAEQLAVSPLGQISERYKRTPTIELAAKTFERDEGMHGDSFRFILEKVLGGKVIPGKSQVDAFWAFRHVLPKITLEGTLFLALTVEVVGTGFFEFFAENSPDPNLANLCRQIAYVDEKRHIRFIQKLYEEYKESSRIRFGKPWEDFRNKQLIKQVGKKIYEQLTDPNQPFMQAIRSLGIDPRKLLLHTFKRLEEELAKIDFKFDPNIIAKDIIKEHAIESGAKI